MTLLSDSLELKCGTVLPNRLVKAAMTEALADNLGRPTSKLCNLYTSWSKGGAGTLITGNVQVDRRYVERPGNVCIDGEQSKESRRMFQKFAMAGQSHHGSKIIVQLSHAGRQSNGMVNMNPVGPGNIRIDVPKDMIGKPRALTEIEIQDVVSRMTNAAKFCKECGFDGVQIHSAHGYLLSSFLNPLANNRPDLFGKDDMYGGSLENRARALLEIVRAVRKETGKNFLLSVKLNSADFQTGGFTTREAAKVAVWLEQEGIDLLEISGGNYESGIFKESTEREPNKTKSTTNTTTMNKKSASTVARECYFLQYALEIQMALQTLPVMVTGGWRTKSAMESVLSNDEFALFGLGRPLCGQPDCAGQLLNGEIDELPRYEDTVHVGYFFLRWIFNLKKVKIFSLIRMISMVSWYYRNMISIAETGNGNESLGAFRSLIANQLHEKKVASELVGINCTGSVYKGGLIKRK